MDSRTFDEDISFALNVREIAKQASGPSLDLRFDLLNEGCVLPTYQPVASIVHAYLVRLLREYAARFGTSDMTVSCFSNPHKMKDPWRARVEMLLNTFRDAGVNPSVFDFHLYVHDSSQIPVILGEIKKLISPWNMKLVVGESLYGNAADTAALAGFVRSNLGFVDEIDRWPVTKLTPCRITVPPPYNVCALANALLR